MFRIQTASRLHFGLLSFGHLSRRQYGGIGMMVERPGLTMIAEPSDRFHASGPLSARVNRFAEHWAGATNCRLPAVSLRVVNNPAEHVGLGTGTQLGLAVAALLFRAARGSQPAAQHLAASVGRGLRSSVGTYGFDYGGLIYERGKLPGEPWGELAAQVTLPAAWRVVQICPVDRVGCSGEQEQSTFQSLPAMPLSVTQRLEQIVDDQILPAARAADLDSLGEGLFEYGWRAGECFAAVQGGPFACRQLEEWVQRLRAWGIRGVGQSSWGPTLFALVPDAGAAEGLIARFRAEIAPTSAGPVRLEASPIAQSGSTAEPIAACGECP